MMPEKFEEKEVRVYNKNKEDSQLDEKIKGQVVELNINHHQQYILVYKFQF